MVAAARERVSPIHERARSLWVSLSRRARRATKRRIASTSKSPAKTDASSNTSARRASAKTDERGRSITVTQPGTRDVAKATTAAAIQDARKGADKKNGLVEGRGRQRRMDERLGSEALNHFDEPRRRKFTAAMIDGRFGAIWYHPAPSRAFTCSFTALPSTTWPASRGIRTFITLPMSFGLVAPLSRTASSMSAVNASGASAAGR